MMPKTWTAMSKKERARISSKAQCEAHRILREKYAHEYQALYQAAKQVQLEK